MTKPVTRSDRSPRVTVKRRWFQWRLRSFLVLVLVVSVGLAWLSHQRKKVRQRRQATEFFQKLDGVSVALDYPEEQRDYWWSALQNDELTLEIILMDFSNQYENSSVLINKDVLTRVRRLKYVQVLLFDTTKINDGGLAYLSELTELTHLGLAGTQITDAGLVHLREFRKLEWLDLSGNEISDKGLNCLVDFAARMKNLRRVNLLSTRTTAVGINNLKRAYPSLQVIHGDE